MNEQREYVDRYPEHSKLSKVAEESNYVTGPFLEWLKSKAVIAELLRMCGRCQTLNAQDATACANPECGAGEGWLGPPRLWPNHRSVEDWLGEYYGIDRKALAAEKDVMLHEFRVRNQLGRES